MTDRNSLGTQPSGPQSSGSESEAQLPASGAETLGPTGIQDQQQHTYDANVGGTSVLDNGDDSSTGNTNDPCGSPDNETQENDQNSNKEKKLNPG